MSDWEEGLSKPADITSRWLHDYCYNNGGSVNGALRVALTGSAFGTEVVFAAGAPVNVTVPDYQGIMVGGYTEGTNVFTGLQFTDAGLLKVDAEVTFDASELAVEVDALDGDTIGIFGFVDGNTANPPVGINVTADGVVRTATSLIGLQTVIFAEASIPTSIETLLLSHIVAASTKFNVVTIEGSGEADGIFILKKNGTVVSKKRNSWSNRNVEFKYEYGLEFNAGDQISLHILQANDASCLFNGTFYGEVTS